MTEAPGPPAAPAMPAEPSPPLAERAIAGDRRALARVLTILESGGVEAAAALRVLYPRAGQARVIGLTGPPGSGKSSLVAALARLYRERGDRVGILAIDPTSPYSGGALLGDRIRMAELIADADVFVRSLASRGTVGGLAAAAPAMAAALDAAGYSRILVETVGVGQDEVTVTDLAHTTVVVTVPGLGDEVQALKAGLLEVADVLVVNKADRPDAERAVAELRLLQSLAPPAAWQPPIIATTAICGDGVDEVRVAIDAHAEYLRSSGTAAQRAADQARAAVLATGQAMLVAKLAGVSAAPGWRAAYAEVAAHHRSPYDVAAEMVAALDVATEA